MFRQKRRALCHGELAAFAVVSQACDRVAVSAHGYADIRHGRFRFLLGGAGRDCRGSGGIGGVGGVRRGSGGVRRGGSGIRGGLRGVRRGSLRGGDFVVNRFGGLQKRVQPVALAFRRVRQRSARRIENACLIGSLDQKSFPAFRSGIIAQFGASVMTGLCSVGVAHVP